MERSDNNIESGLLELLRQMEELGYHHANDGRKDHFRSGQTVWMVYQLAGILLETVKEEPGDD